MMDRRHPWRTAAAAIVLLLVCSRGFAGVHDGGVAACDICHVMHEDGTLVGGDHPLLKVGNSSDTCLACHADANGEVLGLDPLSPPPEYGAGKFVFLLEDNINDGTDGLANPIPGDAAGHNIEAPGYGLASDGTYVVSPGGTYPADRMTCTSCHDPHGNANYRFLYGGGPQPSDGFVFTAAAPTAVGLGLTAGAPESRTNHVAYHAGMSQWCANCHPDYVRDRHSPGSFRHATDKAFSLSKIATYNTYNGSADPSGGLAATAFLPETPFEDPAVTTSSTFGPGSGARIMCLSCHRAHGSSAPRGVRWDFNVTALGQDGVVSGSYPLPNPYPDPGQETLCYKCHKNLSMPGP